MARLHAPDVVLLAPGFLGFSRFGSFYYFTDRVVATVRGILEEALDRPVPVVPCMTLPTDSLARRQRYLLEYMAKLVDTRLTGVERVHLIGHSTGGVDVQLLACSPPLERKAWTADEEKLRALIASVVTISAPHHGTGLAESDLARFGENPLMHPTAIVPLVKTLAHLGALLPRELVAAAGVQVARPNDLFEFLLQVARNRDLIGDLRPDSMQAVRRRAVPDPGVPVTCFATAATPRADAERPSDPFYTHLYDLTAAGSVPHTSASVGRPKRDSTTSSSGGRTYSLPAR
jgi:pimeloyl-ACP methyl ester carboxylesterase